MKSFLLPKIGDSCLILAISLGVCFSLWHKATQPFIRPSYLAIHLSGTLYAQFLLPLKKNLIVSHSLGQTEIEIDNYRTRVIQDPGMQQICVKQGWITQSDDMLICAPSQITVQLLGRKKKYDSMAY